MSSLPRQELHAAIVSLSDKDEYKTVLRFIREGRDSSFADLRGAPNSGEVMKIAGYISALDELLAVLDSNAGSQ